MQSATAEVRSGFPGWYAMRDLMRIRGAGTERTVRRELAEVSSAAKRPAPSDGGRGRPETLYHYTALPWLRVWHERHGAAACVQSAERMAHGAGGTEQRAEGREERAEGRGQSAGERVETTAGPTPEDLAIAELRLTAIRECEVRSPVMGRLKAQEATCQDWSRRQPSRTVRTEERLPDGYRRTVEKTVSLGEFRPRSLRRWKRLYYRKEELLDLTPRFADRGRTESAVPAELLDFVWAMSASTARADVQKAVEHARAHWPGEFPALSISSWRRRISRMDPRKGAQDLMHSVSRFRAKQSPDVERDWSQLAYNSLWQIDDVQEDWYGYSTALQRALRPYAYAVMRVATREWIALVTSATPIAQEQVRTLVGCAMAAKRGGIPDEIKFERGAVAADPHLVWLLGLLGVAVTRTSMDGGQVHAGALADRGIGHFQGKAVIEANMRRGHDLAWAVPTQVGGEERHTKPARTDNVLAAARELEKRGQSPVIPTDAEWHKLAMDLREAHNARPHSGLPQIVDTKTGETRHMCPNERAMQMRDQAVRVMDARYLPMFAVKGERVEVTRNGIRLRNQSFGRFDEGLQALKSVTVYADQTDPEFVYVYELGRCLERYEKEDPTGEGDQIHAKRRTEQAFRNKFEAAVATAIASGAAGPVLVDMVKILSDPVPERPAETVTVPELDTRLGEMTCARDRFLARRAEMAKRFEVPEEGEAAPAETAVRRPAGGRGLLARAEEISNQVAMFGGV